jgi:nucleoside 2-deoxyribosyltransferase
MARVFFSSPVDGKKAESIISRYKRIERLLLRQGHTLVNNAEFYKNHLALHSPSKRAREAIIEADLAMLRQADVLLVDISATNHHYVGCICEMVYATLWGIPVIAHVGRNRMAKRPFFAHHASAMFAKKRDAVDAIGRAWERQSNAREKRHERT